MIKQLSTEEELKQIIRLINKEVKLGNVLPRPKHELWRDKEHVFVYKYDQAHIIGCCQLVIYSPRIAEIRSLVVKESWRGNGIANNLINYCIEYAKKQGIMEIFSITNSEKIFYKSGFYQELNGQKALFIKL